MKTEHTIYDIVNNQLCTGCGICVSESDSKMVWNNQGFLVPDTSMKFTPDAIKLCPFNPDGDINNEDSLSQEFLKDTHKADLEIGNFVNLYAGYSPEYRETSSSGGIATYVFEYLLKNKIVDYLFIVKEIDGKYTYQLFTDSNQIKTISKTRYIPVTMADLFTKIDQIQGKIAISGVACFIKAIRLKQKHQPLLKEKIPFLIGIICGGLKSKFFTDYLSQKSGIQGAYSNQEYRIKDKNSTASDYSFGALDEATQFHQMKMRTVGDMWGTGLFKSNACDFCDDVATELADISLGDAWIRPYNQEGLGNSVIVTRSALADKIISNGILNQELNCKEISLTLFKTSQAGSFRHRQLGMKYRVHKFKTKSGIRLEKRKKFYQNIPFEYKAVQKSRMKIREESLKIWEKEKNAELFENKILPLKKSLRDKTIFYHRVQKLKRILKIKSIQS